MVGWKFKQLYFFYIQSIFNGKSKILELTSFIWFVLSNRQLVLETHFIDAAFLRFHLFIDFYKRVMQYR